MATTKNNLASIMKKYNQTQYSVAEAIPVVHQTINKWINGKQSPGAAFRLRLNEIFVDEEFIWDRAIDPKTLLSYKEQAAILKERAERIAKNKGKKVMALTKKDRDIKLPEEPDQPKLNDRPKHNEPPWNDKPKPANLDEVERPMVRTKFPPRHTQIVKGIILTTSFPATHNWPECNVSGVEFLRHPHRHVFYITMRFPVRHNDRDIEFIAAKKEIDTYIQEHYAYKDLGRTSCEDIAEHFLKHFGANYVCVLEDEENGAEVYTV